MRPRGPRQFLCLLRERGVLLKEPSLNSVVWYSKMESWKSASFDRWLCSAVSDNRDSRNDNFINES